MWINTQYPAPHLLSLNNYALRMQNKLVGWDMIYLRRDKVAIDNILTEVDKSIVKDTFPFKGVLDMNRSFDTGGALLSKFGLSNDVELIFTVSQEDFDRFKSAKQDPNLDSISRPTEGDLIYFPYNDNLWEITFCDNRPTPGFKYNPTVVWEVSCQLYERTNDTLVTGNVDLDKFDTNNVGHVYGMVLEIAPYDPTMTPVIGSQLHQSAIGEDGKESVVWTANVSGYNANTNQLTLKNPIGEFDAMSVLYDDNSTSMFTIVGVKDVITMTNPVNDGAQNGEFDALDSKIKAVANHDLHQVTSDVSRPSDPRNRVTSPEVIAYQQSLLASEQQAIFEKNIQSIKPIVHDDAEFSADNPFGGN